MKHLRPLWYTKRLQYEQKKSIYTGRLFSTLLEQNYIFCFFSYRQSNGMLYSTRSHSQY